MLQINKVSMLVVCDYMCCCWLIYKSTVRGFILLSFAFSIHSFLISLPRNRNGAKASRKLHLNIYEPICLCIRDGPPFVNDITARDPSKRPNPLYFQHYISKEYTVNISAVKITVFCCVPFPAVLSLYFLHCTTAPNTVEKCKHWFTVVYCNIYTSTL